MDTIQRIDPAASHIATLFASKAAQSGGVIRRSIVWANREIGRETLTREVKRRGFHMIACGGQYVIICDHRFLTVVC